MLRRRVPDSWRLLYLSAVWGLFLCGMRAVSIEEARVALSFTQATAYLLHQQSLNVGAHILTNAKWSLYLPLITMTCFNIIDLPCEVRESDVLRMSGQRAGYQSVLVLRGNTTECSKTPSQFGKYKCLERSREKSILSYATASTFNLIFRLEHHPDDRRESTGFATMAGDKRYNPTSQSLRRRFGKKRGGSRTH